MKKINKTTWQERIPIDVPEGYEFSEIRVVYNLIDLTDYSVAIFNRPTCYVNRVLPHKVGDTKEIECDVCWGSGTYFYQNLDYGLHQERDCPTCHGKGNLNLTCKSVTVEGREFVIDWEEV